MNARSTIRKHPWGWALCLSMVAHLLVVSRLGFLWQPMVKSPPPLPLTISLDWTAPAPPSLASPSPAPPSPAGNSPLKSTVTLSRTPSSTPVAVPSPVAPLSESVPAPSGPVPPIAADEGNAPASSLVWHSLGMAHQLVANPWAGRRVTYLNAATTQPEWLAYEEAFSNKVAEVGGVNYPPPQNGHPLSGSVRVATVLNADGSVAAVELLQSSGQPALDQAAQHIVQMAAPFLPFTENMRAHTDLVRIVRTFNFVRAGEPLGSY